MVVTAAVAAAPNSHQTLTQFINPSSLSHAANDPFIQQASSLTNKQINIQNSPQSSAEKEKK